MTNFSWQDNSWGNDELRLQTFLLGGDRTQQSATTWQYSAPREGGNGHVLAHFWQDIWWVTRTGVGVHVAGYNSGVMYLPSPGSAAPPLRGRWSCLGLRTGVSPHFSMNSMREILNEITRGGGCSPSRAPWPTHKMADDSMYVFACTHFALFTY
jgi:hypothetical protein